jgi:CheY-like chemotaxis protein
MHTVLVVEDDPALRTLMVRTLSAKGYRTLEASDGIEALERLAADPDIELVVTDIVMPRMNGVELMQALSTTAPDLPVILMSGYATGALAELGINAPCAILPKPFPAERLLQEVQRCTRRRESA